MRITQTRHVAAASLLIASAACASVPHTSPSPAVIHPGAPANSPPPARDVQWARSSAEHRAIFIETFRSAADRLPTLSSGHPAGTWGVILDGDETVLDNSEYEVGRIPFGGSYDRGRWADWALQGRAPALPGAVEFTNRVHNMGGKVVIVSNRNATLCPVTRANIRALAIPADLVLCKTTTDDKNPRFDAVLNGTAETGFPAIAVVEWIGDNIEDFPRLNQTLLGKPDSAYDRFGKVYFALPNAMYGSWQANPFP